MTKLIQNRRGFIKSAAATGLILSSPAYLRTASAQGAGQVNVWAYDGFVPGDFVDQFQDETGIKVNMRLVDDQGKQFNLMAAERQSPTADIVTVAGHRFLQFIDSDLIAPLDTSRLSNWGAINPVFSESDWSTVSGNKWGVPILSGAEIMAYNSDMATIDQPSSWDTMFSDEWAGQNAYILQDMFSIVMLYLGYDGNMVAYMDDPEEAARIVNETRDFLIENKSKVRKYYDAGAEIQQMFINQDVSVAHSWNGPIAKLIADGFPVKMTIPKEGSYGFVYTLNVAQGGPNTDNAYTFLDFLMSKPEYGAEMSRQSGFISTYKGASDHLSDEEKAATSFPEEELSRLQFFRAEANEMKYALVDRAVEEVRAA
ncbi:ABC transporter substrate-binding protein [Oceaniglobus ichthyenteri]|uniref:ABC transporter substrate-binding protein n=1 Tax=Oceaniglobus ichthyenteri TaxID=2136177 RepID=UPI000D3879C3|nr:extracellular solute-binding protein [Oceaniglobus ichthyenteri]